MADVVPLHRNEMDQARLDPATINRRILVVDDNPRIHDDFRTILVRDSEGVDFLLDMEAELFGEPEPRKSPEVSFEVDSAYQGREGLEMVKKALEEGRPYAMAFVDVRMPPGWDGIETIKRVWAVDPDLQVVICTAYSDYSWEETVEILDPCERFLILKKPFDTVVVRQLAHSLTEKWQLSQEAKRQLQDLRSTVDERSRDLEQAHDQLRKEITERRKVETVLRRAWELEGQDSAEAAGELEESFNDLNELLASYQSLLNRDGADQTVAEHEDQDLEQLLREIPGAVSRTLEGIERVSAMVRALRDAGGERGKPTAESTDLNKVVAGAFADTLDDYSYVAEVECDYGSLQPVTCYPDELARAFRHVIRNAARAVADNVADTGEKGSITCRTWTDGDAVVVTITDSGGGIPEPIQDQIFEPFFTTTGGAGQGLAVARDIVVDRHRGQLSFESELGKGTTFTIRIPR